MDICGLLCVKLFRNNFLAPVKKLLNYESLIMFSIISLLSAMDLSIEIVVEFTINTPYICNRQDNPYINECTDLLPTVMRLDLSEEDDIPNNRKMYMYI